MSHTERKYPTWIDWCETFTPSRDGVRWHKPIRRQMIRQERAMYRNAKQRGRLDYVAHIKRGKSDRQYIMFGD